MMRDRQRIAGGERPVTSGRCLKGGVAGLTADHWVPSAHGQRSTRGEQRPMARRQRPTTIGRQLRTNQQRATANGQRVADDAQRSTAGKPSTIPWPCP